MQEIIEFFNSYAQAYDKKDVDATVDFFHLPSLVIFGPRISTYTKKEEIQASLQQLMGLYKQKGFGKTNFTITSVLSFDKNNHVVTLLWTVLNKEGQQATQFHCNYQLIQTPKGLKIIVVTNLEEKL